MAPGVESGWRSACAYVGCLSCHQRGDPYLSGMCMFEVPVSAAMPSSDYSGRCSSKRMACDRRSHQCN